MKTVRVLAIATLVLIGAYFVFRAVVSACTGTSCDAYIPLSLLIPILILILVALTGTVATIDARKRHAWFAALIGVTLIGVAGPLIALAVFKDSPDTFVLTATVPELLAACTALAYTVWGGRAAAGSTP